MLRRHGDLDEALGLYTQVLPKWKELGHRSAVAHELECVAFILFQRDHLDQALTILGAAEVLREVAGPMSALERVEYDQVVNGLRERVEGSKFRQSWDAGRAMDMEHAVDYALQAATAAS